MTTTLTRRQVAAEPEPVVSSKMGDETLSAEQVLELLPTLNEIEGAGVFNIPAGQYEIAGGSIINFGRENASRQVIGAEPLVTRINGVLSIVEESADSYLVTYSLDNAENVAVGEVLKLNQMRPHPLVNGDNIYLFRDDAGGNLVPHEIQAAVEFMGTINAVQGSSSTVFSKSTAQDNVDIGDLIVSMGEVGRVTAKAGATITTDRAWSVANVGRDFYRVKSNAGTVSVSYGTVTGVGTNFLSTVNVGDMFLANEIVTVITAVSSDTSMTIAVPFHMQAGAAFATITPAVVHEGAHVITAVNGNEVTARVKSYFKPPLLNVTGGDAVVIKTVFRNMGNGDAVIAIEEGAALGLINNIAFINIGGDSGSVGLGLAGNRGDVHKFGNAATINCEFNTAFIGWGRGAILSAGCVADIRGNAFSACQNLGVWMIEDSYCTLRQVSISGAGSRGLAVNSGATAVITEVRITGCNNDGAIYQTGASLYGEAPLVVGNQGMGIRDVAGTSFNSSEGVIALNLYSGLYLSGGRGSVKRMVILANGRNGVEALSGSSYVLEECWISGNYSASSQHGRGVSGINSRLSMVGGAITGNQHGGVDVIKQSTFHGEGAHIVSNKMGEGLFGQEGVNAVHSTATIEGGQADVLRVGTHGVIDWTGFVYSPAVYGVGAVNVKYPNGRLITNGSAVTFEGA